MKKEVCTLVTYRLERARESLEEAKILLEQGYANTFVNRLYYACFYAVSSLLLTKELFSAKHSRIRSLFHQNFVKVGMVNTELGQLYDRLFDNRQKADYADLFRFNPDEVRYWYDEVKKFVEFIENIIKKEMENNYQK
ncbi:MAG: HEPN domain-containing protein [Candidatus Scalindua sediminis]|jgi:uncharacterized protein (UPF0332 family)|nr:HEPN domain-containing protein [Candidatus Scalindua sediminis]